MRAIARRAIGAIRRGGARASGFAPRDCLRIRERVRLESRTVDARVRAGARAPRVGVRETTNRDSRLDKRRIVTHDSMSGVHTYP